MKLVVSLLNENDRFGKGFSIGIGIGYSRF